MRLAASIEVNIQAVKFNGDYPMPQIQNLARWFRLLVIVAVLLVVGLIAAGAAYQAFENSRDAKRFPQVGTLVQAGPIKLNIICQGNAADKPTVILESAGGVAARGWAKVQPEVAKFARVCSYDRAGYGWSEPGPLPRTMEQEAQELKALLEAAGETGPYILVGHSQGGFNCQVFANKYPDDVAGVVLVDASHPDTIKRTLEVLSKKGADELSGFMKALNTPWGNMLTTWTVRLGLFRLLTPQKDDLDREINYLSWQPKAMQAFQAETAVFDTISTDQVRAAGNLGDRPLIVLTAGKADDSYASPVDATAARRLWVEEIQAEMAQLSSRGKQVVVPDSGHMIPMERPDAVVDAILDVWEQAKTTAHK